MKEKSAAMSIAALISDLPIEHTTGEMSIAITDVVEDSRRSTRGSLFIARPGHADDGARYIDDAIERGAIAVLARHGTSMPPAVVGLVCADPARIGAVLAERIHGSPSSSLALVGVTGTNGKTTTAHLTHHLLTTAGRRTGVIGTVLVDTGGAIRAAGLTTPGGPETSGLLAEMVANGCTACVMEASSHALEQGRTAGLSFTGAIFTNLSGDHLDYHPTMDAYLDAKLELVRQLPSDGWLIVNDDDDVAPRVTDAAPGVVVLCSLSTLGRSCSGIIRESQIDSTTVSFVGPWGSIEVRLPLPGRHNVMNALQATAAAWKLGVSAGDLANGLMTATAPPGRLELVDTLGLGFTVFVDYAHTDDALRNVLSTIRPLVPADGRLRVLFGCGGDRDRSKRPRMTQVALDHADDVIVTSDNPRTEDPDAIIEDAMAAVPAERMTSVIREVDRGVAIRQAVSTAREGDVIVIAGKGHEDYQIIGRERRWFDDRIVAREAIEERSRQVARS